MFPTGIVKYFIGNHQVGNRSLNGCVGVLADSESEKRRLMVLPFVLESIMTQPAQPPSGRIAHLCC
jgi:hypothetical protein